MPILVFPFRHKCCGEILLGHTSHSHTHIKRHTKQLLNKSFHVFSFCFTLIYDIFVRRRMRFCIPVGKHIILSICTISSGTNTKYIYYMMLHINILFFSFSLSAWYTLDLFRRFCHTNATASARATSVFGSCIVSVLCGWCGKFISFTILFRFTLNHVFINLILNCILHECYHWKLAYLWIHWSSFIIVSFSLLFICCLHFFLCTK